MAYYVTRAGRFFQDRLLAATEVLHLIDKRFELDDDSDAKDIYYWIVNVERVAKQIGMRYYSRRGTKTLIGVLHTDRLWLRANAYETSNLTLDDLLGQDGRIRPQEAEGRIVDFEKLMDSIRRETQVLKDLFQQYTDKEIRLIEEFEQIASERIREV